MATKKSIYKLLFPYSRPVKIDFVSKSDVEIIFKSTYILSKHITLYLNTFKYIKFYFEEVLFKSDINLFSLIQFNVSLSATSFGFSSHVLTQ